MKSFATTQKLILVHKDTIHNTVLYCMIRILTYNYSKIHNVCFNCVQDKGGSHMEWKLFHSMLSLSDEHFVTYNYIKEYHDTWYTFFQWT